MQLIFAPWTKFCLKGQPGQAPDPNAKQVCFTGKDARIEFGMSARVYCASGGVVRNGQGNDFATA